MTLSSTTRATYRPDVDGLRGIAVLAVVLYHAGFTQFFGGGYVGVDIFFVLSGYLITGIIYREHLAGTFSFLNFYERRIRRIVPAFFVMAIFCTVGAYFALPSEYFKKHGTALLRAALCTANFYYYRHTGGYFDAPTHNFPLLHTWSLSVEEQFYFIFPLLLLLLLKFFPKRYRALLVIAASASLVSGAVFVRVDQPYAFYMLPTRAWELLCGALLTLFPAPRLSNGKKEAMIFAGLALIAFAVVGYSWMPELLFPGLAALPPCLGAALCIIGGTDKERNGLFYGLLACRPLLFIGLISYSLYLWHWPIFVLYRHLFFQVSMSTTTCLVLIVVSILMAVLSWKYVEQPIRHKRILKKKMTLYAAGILALSALAGLGWTIYRERIPAFIPVRAEYTPENLFNIPKLLSTPPPALAAEIQGKAHFFGDPDMRPSIIVLGDSHGFALGEVFDQLAKKYHRAGLLFSHNPPFFNCRGAQRLPEREWQQGVQGFIEKYQPDTVLIAARYAVYLKSELPGEAAGRAAHVFDLICEDKQGVEVSDPDKAFDLALEYTQTYLRQHGVQRRFMLLPVPEQDYRIPDNANRLLFLGRDAHHLLSVSVEQFQTRQDKTMRGLERLVQADPGVTLLDPAPILCPDGKRCYGLKDGIPLYLDDDHLSRFGAEQLSDLLEPVFATTP